MISVLKPEIEHKGIWKVDFSANTKRTQDDPKLCAETQLLRMAQDPESDIDEVALFVVAGYPQKDDDSHKELGVLTPCKVCRDALWETATSGDPRVSPKTQVICIHRKDVAHSAGPLHTSEQDDAPPLMFGVYQTTVGSLHELHVDQTLDQDDKAYNNP